MNRPTAATLAAMNPVMARSTSSRPAQSGALVTALQILRWWSWMISHCPNSTFIGPAGITLPLTQLRQLPSTIPIPTRSASASNMTQPAPLHTWAPRCPAMARISASPIGTWAPPSRVLPARRSSIRTITSLANCTAVTPPAAMMIRTGMGDSRSRGPAAARIPPA